MKPTQLARASERAETLNTQLKLALAEAARIAKERDQLKAQLALALSDSAQKDEQLASLTAHRDTLRLERNELRAECEQLKRGLTTAFGIHKDKPIDAVEHQRQLRAEWEDSQGPSKPDA